MDAGIGLGGAREAQLQGDWAAAERLYRKEIALAGCPDPALLANYGQVLRRLGRDEEAVAVYRRAVAQPSAPAAAWFNLGNTLFDQGEWRQAEDCFLRALERDQVLSAAALQLARCAVLQGRWSEARERFAAVLRLEPANFSAWLEAGHLCRQHGTQAQMVACYRQAVAAAPERWLGHASLARGLELAGQRDAAAGAYFQALRCPDAADGLEVHRLLGKGRLECGDAPGAVEALCHALTVAPVDHECMIDLADALMCVGENREAEALFQRVLGEAGRHETLTRLAEVLFRYNLWQPAEAALRRIAATRPEDWSVHFNLGKLLVETWRMDEGEAELARAEALAPRPVAGAASLRAAAAGKCGDADACLALYRQLSEEDGINSPFRSSAAMAALYSDTLSAQAVADLHRELFAPLAEGARTGFANDRTPDRCLRIGYVTADLHHQHPVNLFLQPVLARHDAVQFEITVYFVGVTVDDQTRQARARVARWRDVHALSDRRLAETIAEDQIDILVDLMGHTSHNRRALFARRAAPVQASFLGYPSTTGIPNMDWIVADAVVAPEERAALFSERVVRLPHCVFCYAPEADYPYPGFGMAHLKRPLTFGSFNNIAKLTLRTVRLWARVLSAVPGSRLLLKAPSFMDPSAVRRYTDLFVAAGVAAERLEFRGPVGLAEMMAEYEDVDIALDTAPYGGGTTTCQALWMGAPVVTLAGENFCSRMGASILTSIGRPEWVAYDEEEFVALAARLAADRKRLTAEKRVLREQMLSMPGQDIERYTRDLEGGYRQMWMAWISDMRID